MSERFGPAVRLISLAQELARRSQRGMTISEMMAFTGTSRKTTERMRDALVELWPTITAEWDDEKNKRWKLLSKEGLLGLQPTADEMADLTLATSQLRKSGHHAMANRLRSLSEKLEVGTNKSLWRKIDPDLEFLNDNLALVSRPGPYEKVDYEIEQSLRQAMLAQQQVILHYRPRSMDRHTKPLICPYGFLVGHRHYLVGYSLQKSVRDFRLYALSGISQVDFIGRTFERDAEFSLADYANQSFGVFQGDPVTEVVLRFSPDVARDAENYVFHPTQTIERMEDGAVLVKFQCGGHIELCWHLFTWGNATEILEPEGLKTLFREMLKEALDGFA